MSSEERPDLDVEVTKEKVVSPGGKEPADVDVDIERGDGDDDDTDEQPEPGQP